jgi:hypothetical protein
MLSRRIVLVAALLGASLAVAPSASFADPPAPAPAAAPVPEALMNGLAVHAAKLEDMSKRVAFTFAGNMEEVDSDGKGTDPKSIVLRSTPTGKPRDRITEVFKCIENGEDKTADAQKQANEKREKRLKDGPSKDDRKELHVPFLPSQQTRYVFTMGERDPQEPNRVRVHFVPKVPAEDAIKGSAWVDEKDREMLSIGFSFSKNPMFVDHVEVSVVFGLATPLGRGPSKASFDGKGGFLFLHKHYRGTGTLSDPKLAF